MKKIIFGFVICIFCICFTLDVWLETRNKVYRQNETRECGDGEKEQK